MSLPNPSMDFTPFDILTAAEMDDLVENIEALAAGTGLDTSSVTTAKIADDAVTAAKIDWASTGAGAGIWWEELGRTTLGSNGDTISVTGLPARKYLRLLVFTTGTASTRQLIRFNNDSGSNYCWRNETNGAADTTGVSTTAIIISAASNSDKSAVVDVINVATKEKRTISAEHEGGTGAATAPGRVIVYGKWVNTTDQISRIDVINDDGAGDFVTGSEVVVLGHN